jgi:RNA polymerase subunit RPABC4/transcription elongation factor Spt4
MEFTKAWLTPPHLGVVDEPCHDRAATLSLNQAMLCLDCEAVFRVVAESCPRCASQQWVPLARFLNRDKSDTVAPSKARPE